MALIQFSCIATGPFITFKETAERIFEALGEPFHEHGAFAAEDLPSILAKLDAAAAADRKLEQEIEIERETRLRTGSYDAELRALEAEKEQTDKTKHHENSVRLYQRIAPTEPRPGPRLVMDATAAEKDSSGDIPLPSSSNTPVSADNSQMKA